MLIYGYMFLLRSELGGPFPALQRAIISDLIVDVLACLSEDLLHIILGCVAVERPSMAHLRCFMEIDVDAGHFLVSIVERVGHNIAALAPSHLLVEYLVLQLAESAESLSC